jgi:hypothetical protein
MRMALIAALTAADVALLLSAAGFNPGTTRLVNGELHQLTSVRVTGKNGQWTVKIRERAVK